MSKGMQSGCINHPGMAASTRCKQCGTPVCDSCVIAGATGHFCSSECKEKHEAFIQRAQAQEQKGGMGVMPRVKGLIRGIIVLVVVAFVVGVVAALLGIEIPVLTDLVNAVKEKAGL